MRKEATVDKSIIQLGQDLAQAAYAKRTQKEYVRIAEHVASRFGRPVAQVTREQLRTYVEEIGTRGKSAQWVITRLAALKFLFRKTLGRPELVSFICYPRRHLPLPTILSLDEVGALIGAIRVARYQAIIMVLYGAGLRIAEALSLEVTDIDGARGVIRVRHGKGNKAREAKLSPTLYDWLRRYWAREPRPSGWHSRTLPRRRGSKSE
jgi:site-specific recombinase XerD